MFRGYDRYIKTKRMVKNANITKDKNTLERVDGYPPNYANRYIRQKLIDEYDIYVTVGEIISMNWLKVDDDFNKSIGNTTIRKLADALNELNLDYKKELLYDSDVYYHDKTRWDRNIALSKDRKNDRKLKADN